MAVVDSTDPSALWGSVLEWPQALAAGWKPTRAPGNLVITRGAAPVVYVDRKGRKIWMFDSWTDGVDDWVLTLLAHWQATGRRRVELWAADDGPVQAHPVGRSWHGTVSCRHIEGWSFPEPDPCQRNCVLARNRVQAYAVTRTTRKAVVERWQCGECITHWRGI